MRWDRYWNDQPRQFGETEFLSQVGRTIGGRPYSDEEFATVVERIGSNLRLSENDTLLDICCGNGAITARLANRCALAVGVDFSEHLIDIARRYHAPGNATYVELDVMKLDEVSHPVRYSRALLYGSLQHFSQRDLPVLLRKTVAVMADDGLILFGAIPDARLRSVLFNTRKKRLRNTWYRMRRRDAMGMWWDREVVASAFEALGLESRVLSAEENCDPLTAHYRFDILAWPSKNRPNGEVGQPIGSR